MYFAQLDGEITNKQSQELLIKNTRKQQNQKIRIKNKNQKNSILSTQIKRKWCYFYTFLTFQCEGYFYCPKRADDILKASMEYQSTDYKRRYISWKK